MRFPITVSLASKILQSAISRSGWPNESLREHWFQTTNLPFLAASAPNLSTVFAANVDTVFVSHDLGRTWLLASNNLPAMGMILGGSGPEPIRWAVQSECSRILRQLVRQQCERSNCYAARFVLRGNLYGRLCRFHRRTYLLAGSLACRRSS